MGHQKKKVVKKSYFFSILGRIHETDPGIRIKMKKDPKHCLRDSDPLSNPDPFKSQLDPDRHSPGVAWHSYLNLILDGNSENGAHA